jgi:uncharacterized membrane protein
MKAGSMEAERMEVGSVEMINRGRGTLSPAARGLFEVLTLAALVLPVIWLAMHWSQIPARVPMHWNLQGRVNGIGPKSVLWMLPGIALFLYLLLLAFSYMPRVYNLPAPVGDPRRPAMEHLGIELMLTIRLEVVTMIGLTALAAARSAILATNVLSPWFFLGGVTVVIATCVLFLLEMFMLKKPRTA